MNCYRILVHASEIEATIDGEHPCDGFDLLWFDKTKRGTIKKQTNKKKLFHILNVNRGVVLFYSCDRIQGR